MLPVKTIQRAVNVKMEIPHVMAKLRQKYAMRASGQMVKPARMLPSTMAPPPALEESVVTLAKAPRQRMVNDVAPKSVTEGLFRIQAVNATSPVLVDMSHVTVPV